MNLARIEKPNVKTFLLLAVPAMLSALLNNAYRLIDQYAVQWIGTPQEATEAQAAIGASGFVLIAAYALFLMISAGAGPLIARAEGAQDNLAKNRIISLSLSAMVGIGFVFCATLILGKEWIVTAVGLTGGAAEQMTAYLHYLGLSGFFIAFGPLIDSIYIAIGNTRFPMILQGVSTVLNAILNWIFIIELQWGIVGAALASGISRGVVSLIGLAALWKDYKPQLRYGSGLKRIVKVGTPIALGTLMYALVYWAILKVAISPLGPAVNAALGIGFSALEGVSWPLFAGIMMAVSSLIGRQLGAKRPDYCDQTISIAFKASTVVGLCVAVIFFVAADPLCSLFTTDPETYAEAVLYAKVLAFSQLFVAYEALTEGILAGAGDTKTVFWISAPINLIRIPLSWWLAIAMGWQAAGVWWAINMTTYAKALLKGLMVKKGKWKEIEP